MTLDLNCDLGEGEPSALTRSLMRWITSANVACGGHAGDAASMRRCVQLAGRHQVRLGAHPGPWDRTGHGRGDCAIPPAELELLLLHQIGALETAARHQSVPLHHIKLHGALYHAVEYDPALARAYVRIVSQHWPKARIIALSGGQVVRAAERKPVRVWREVFADRAYQPDGRLVPRSQPGSVLHELDAVRARLDGLREGFVEAIDGTRLPLGCDTICVHADSPNALATVRLLKRATGT